MKHLGSVRFRFRQTGDRYSRLVFPGITRRASDYANTRPRLPGRLHRLERARSDCHQGFGQIGSQAEQQRLRLRVAEANIIFEHLRPVRSDHQSKIENAAVNDPLRSQALQSRRYNVAQDALGKAIGEDVVITIRAHAAGIGTEVLVPYGLVVLCWGERQRRLAIRQHLERHFFAFELLFQNDPSSCFAHQTPGEKGFENRPGL